MCPSCSESAVVDAVYHNVLPKEAELDWERGVAVVVAQDGDDGAGGAQDMIAKSRPDIRRWLCRGRVGGNT